MESYIVCLALSYFKEKGNKYDFGDLRSLLGFTQSQLDKLMVFLRENELVKYVNFEIKITNKGLRYLIAQNQINSSLEDAEYGLSNIDAKTAISFETPYVPKKFSKKV